MASAEEASLDGLYCYLFNEAGKLKNSGDLAGAKVLLRYLLNQNDISKKQRRQVHLLLALISFGDNPPTSAWQLEFRSSCLFLWNSIKSIILFPINLIKMLRNEPDPTPEEVLAHQNAMREARVRRELKTAAREADLSKAHRDSHPILWESRVQGENNLTKTQTVETEESNEEAQFLFGENLTEIR